MVTNILIRESFTEGKTGETQCSLIAALSVFPFSYSLLVVTRVVTLHVRCLEKVAGSYCAFCHLFVSVSQRSDLRGAATTVCSALASFPGLQQGEKACMMVHAQNITYHVPSP